MKSRTVTVNCEQGLHLLIASQVAKIAMRCGGTVQIRSQGQVFVNACDAMEVMTLGAAVGTPLEITADGTDETSVLRDLIELIEMGAAV